MTKVFELREIPFYHLEPEIPHNQDCAWFKTSVTYEDLKKLGIEFSNTGHREYWKYGRNIFMVIRND